MNDEPKEKSEFGGDQMNIKRTAIPGVRVGHY